MSANNHSRAISALNALLLIGGAECVSASTSHRAEAKNTAKLHAIGELLEEGLCS